LPWYHRRPSWLTKEYEYAMQIKIPSLFMLGLLITLFSLPDCKPANTEDDEFTEIALEESGSFGVPSGFKIVLRKDGAASYYGEAAAKLKGNYRGRISEQRFQSLEELLREKKFLSLEEKYDSRMKDAQTFTIKVVYSKGKKTVVDYGGKQLSEIAQAISKLADQINWVKDE
jgi:hypothetical protein